MKHDNHISVLLYHQIGHTPSRYTNLDCFCNVESFYKQMEFLKNSDYKVISLSKALSLITKKEEIDNDYVVLTFDDGCENFYDIAYPILDEFDFRPTIYPVVGYLGEYAKWGNMTYPYLKILSRRKLIELSRLGVEIGAHTLHHLKLTEIVKDEIFYQIKQSKELLEQLLGKKILSFAYPHGKFNSEVIKVVKKAGFNNAVTCINDYAEHTKSLFEIPRKYITYSDNLNSFKLKLSNK